jgi:hypothetical protein
LICDNTLSNKSGNDRLKNRDAGVVPSVARQAKFSKTTSSTDNALKIRV